MLNPSGSFIKIAGNKGNGEVNVDFSHFKNQS
jgi:hypothetical protein